MGRGLLQNENGGICKCENEVTCLRRATGGSPNHLPSGRQGVCGPTHLPVRGTHSPRVTRVPAPQGRAVSHALAVPHVLCHTHTHRITQRHTQCLTHSDTLVSLARLGSLAPPRALGAALGTPFPQLKVCIHTPGSQVPQFKMTSRLWPARGKGKVF